MQQYLLMNRFEDIFFIYLKIGSRREEDNLHPWLLTGREKLPVLCCKLSGQSHMLWPKHDVSTDNHVKILWLMGRHTSWFKYVGI